MRNQEIRSLKRRGGEGDLRYEPRDTVRLDFPRDSGDLDEDEEDDIITAAAPHTYGRTSPLTNFAFSHFG